MAKYRQVYIEFWQDSFVLDLTPEEKYFYLYLMTNSKTTQCGIYELPLRIIEMETGYNRETVWKLLERFQEYGKIYYDKSTKEVMIVNWIKYNWINSPKVITFIKKELGKVKTASYIKIFYEKCQKYGYDIDRVSIDSVEEGEKEIEKEVKEEFNSIQELLQYYLSKNIICHQKITGSMKETIQERLKDYSIEELKQAMDNYATVFHSDEYWFNYKYPLADLMQDKNIRKFLNEADPLQNFKRREPLKEKSIFDQLREEAVDNMVLSAIG